jgi:hypothetical protein
VTPFQLAERFNSSDIVEQLIAATAELESVDYGAPLGEIIGKNDDGEARCVGTEGLEDILRVTYSPPAGE